MCAAARGESTGVVLRGGTVGNGTNQVFVAPEQDLVIVVRWIEDGSIDEVLGKALGATIR